ATLQLGLVGAAQDDELDASILAPAVFVVLAADRLGLAVAVVLERAGLDPALDQRPLDRRGTALGQLQVVLVVAALVGVTLDLDERDLRVALEGGGDGVQQRERLGLDVGLVGLEVDLVEDLQLALAHDDPSLVGAAIVVLDAVVGLGLVGALVVDVENPVLVVVGIGAAVLILEAV